MKNFNKSFTQQESIPEAGIEAAVEVMRSGRLHRYNTQNGERSETDLLEIEFADYMGVPFALACASGGYALHIAMRAAGVEPGDKVLCNAFTLAPVPGAIHNAGAEPVLVEMAEDLCIDLDDLERQADNSGAGYLLLSHMRGHIADMERVMAICHRYDLVLIEDCAHTMGASWDEKKSGTFGDVACFSMQTYKHINCGEGGLLICRDEHLMARAIMHSGSYMLFDNHCAAPEAAVFNDIRLTTPNYSGRMDNLRAAVLRPQLKDLDQQCQRWNSRYRILASVLQQCSLIELPVRVDKEQFVASSIQFCLPSFCEVQLREVVRQCAERGVVLKWFGSAIPEGYTSRYDSWRYMHNMPKLSLTEARLARLLDMRIPLTFSEADCQLLGEIIAEVVSSSSKDSL